MPLKMLGYFLNDDGSGASGPGATAADGSGAAHPRHPIPDTYQDKLASEEAVLCLGWNRATGGLADPTRRASDIRYVLPSEGTLFWMDAWVLMADAPHPNAAYAWFDFIERPDNQAKESVYTGYGTPNLEAKKLLPQDMLDDPAIFPPADVMAKLEGADPATAANEDRLAVWTEFKSNIG